MLSVLIAILIIVGVTFMFWSINRSARISNERKKITLDTFRDEFLKSEYAEKAITEAYNDFIILCNHPVYKNDDIEHTLNIVPDDFNNILEKRCKKYGIFDVWNSSYANLFPLKTVEDYVKFLSTIILNERQRN